VKYRDLRDFIAQLERQGQLKRIAHPVSTHLEMTEISDRVLRAAGDALLFDGRGRRPVDFAFALRHLRPGDLVTVQVDAGSVVEGGVYRGEQLNPRTFELFAALREDRLAEFLLNNRDLVS